MGKISDWLDNFLMGGDEGKMVDISSIEKEIDTEKHLKAGKLRIEEACKRNQEKEDAEGGLKFVIDGAKIRCDLCTIPDGDLKANYDTPSIQDKRVVTVVEKDMKSLIFKGNCKKSTMSSSPCASVMKLGEWQNPGTVYYQDELAVLLRSTIKCEYGGVDIKIWDCGQRNEITNLDTTGAPVPSFIPPDFDIAFELDKTEKTVVPFGILDFKNKAENPFFSFKYTLSKSKIDSLDFQIADQNDTVIYQMTHLETVIVKASKKPELLFETKKPTEGPLISKTWDYQEIYKQHALFEPADYTQIGEYYIHWDGFDTNEVYDSTRFNNKDLKAKITATKDGKQKSIVVDFSTKYSQVNWTDVKIDKKTKRIDVTLRVNLTDGGAEGIDPIKMGGVTDINRTVNPWDKIPASVITPSKPIIKIRTRSFKELEKLALDGLNYHWGRNKNNLEGKDVMIDGEKFEVYTNSLNTEIDSMDDIDLVFNTNTNWGRSNNPGSVTGVKSFFANLAQYIPYVPLSETIYYNVGHLNFLYEIQSDFSLENDDWRYINEKDMYIDGITNVDMDFSYTSAHELGHSILKAYAEGADGTEDYSYQHKGSSDYSNTKPPTKGGFVYPKNGEIDLMKYFNNDPQWYDFKRVVADDDDVLGLIWLTKIKIK